MVARSKKIKRPYLAISSFKKAKWQPHYVIGTYVMCIAISNESEAS